MNAFTKIIQNLACSLRARPVQRGLTRYLGSLWDERKVLRQHRRQAGLALLEMLVALSILSSIGVTALMGLSTGLMATSRVSNSRTALDIAQSQMEYIKAQDFAPYILWDDLNDKDTPVKPKSWTGYNTQSNKVTLDGADYSPLQGNGSLQIEDNNNDYPGTVTQSGLNLDWRAYDGGKIYLSAKADGTEEIHIRLIDEDGDWEEYHSAALSAVDTWEDLEFDLSADPDAYSGTLGDMDWHEVDQIAIYANKTSPSDYFFHIDNLCLKESGYAEYDPIPTEELHGWEANQLAFDVVPESENLQSITVTVTYPTATSDKTFVLEGYKSRR
jgi:type II secretory pathway pseudopilin PulG